MKIKAYVVVTDIPQVHKVEIKVNCQDPEKISKYVERVIAETIAGTNASGE